MTEYERVAEESDRGVALDLDWLLVSPFWTEAVERLRLEDLDAVIAPDWGGRPATISVVVPVYRPDLRFLDAMLESVLGQTYPYWELICVDDGSDRADITRALARAAVDPRVSVLTRLNGGIVAATNDGLSAATGEFVALLDHDDTLELDALSKVAEVIARYDDVDLIYTDEDHIDSEGVRSNTFPKPDFSPERLRGQMYTGHLSVYRRSLISRLGGMREGYDGSQDYDLVLRAIEMTRRVVHIPEVLYHWRIHGSSVSQRADNAAVFDAARRALTDHLARTGIAGVVEQIHDVGIYRIRREVVGQPLISVIIPTRGSSALVHGELRCMVTAAVQSILERSSYTNLEFVIVADEVMSEEVRVELRQALGERLKIVPWSAPFNFSAKINRGAMFATGDYILLLNDDIEVITADWLETMLALCQQEDVGMVGPMLYFEDGTIQHGGHRYADGGPGHVALGEPRGSVGEFGSLLIEREASGVTAACAMMPRRVFFEVGGMYAGLPVNFNDVDLCLKVTSCGYRILWTPFAELFHYESKTRIAHVTQFELNTARKRWGHRLQSDPFWHFDDASFGDPRSWF